ncbi:MAG: hypothetical protein ACRD29_24370 [Acidimicrobiales bacterium]
MLVPSTLRAPTRFDPQRLVWLLPVAVYLAVRFAGTGHLERGVGALLAAGIVVVAARHADRAVLVLIAGFPFQTIALAQLYAWGVPASIVRPLASWKEAIAFGLVIAAFRGRADSRAHDHRRLDLLDRLALCYVLIVVIYAAVPGLFAPDAPSALSARFIAFRQSAVFVALLVAARHAVFPPGFLARAGRVALVTAAAVGAIALYEWAFSDTWNRWAVRDARVTAYQVEVLDIRPRNFFDIRYYGPVAGRQVVRVGSVLFSPLTLGFYLLIGFAVGIERAVRAPSARVVAALGAVALALVATQTRSAILGALLIAVVALRPLPGRRPHGRVRFALLLTAGLLLALPVAASSGLAARATGAFTGEEKSATAHVASFFRGVETLIADPLGRGLATSAGAGLRFAREEAVIAENSYLQVGNETGLTSMAVFAALSVALVFRLRRAATSVGDPTAAAVFGAAVGLTVGAFFLHTWADLVVSWTFWVLAGAAVGAADRTTAPVEGVRFAHDGANAASWYLPERG